MMFKKLLLKPCQCVSKLMVQYNAFQCEYTLSSIFSADTTDIEIFFVVLVIICQTYSRLFFVFFSLISVSSEEYHDIAMSLCGELKNGKVALGN